MFQNVFIEVNDRQASFWSCSQSCPLLSTSTAHSKGLASLSPSPNRSGQMSFLLIKVSNPSVLPILRSSPKDSRLVDAQLGNILLVLKSMRGFNWFRSCDKDANGRIQMQTLLNRWKNAISSTEDLRGSRNEPNPPIPITSSAKKRVNSHLSVDNKSHKKAEQTPTPKSRLKQLKQSPIDICLEAIISQFLQGQKSRGKVRALLQNFKEAIEKPFTIQIKEIQPPVQPSPQVNRVHEKLYNDLQKKYFQCEKERQHFKGKAEGLLKKYEHVEQQIQRCAKIERLIDGSIEREAQMRKEMAQVRREREVAEARLVEQQRIFGREVSLMRGLIEQLRTNLPE